MIKIAFYDAKEYDKPSFERYGAAHEMQFRFLETRLNEDTVELARGCEAVCVFVNDTVNAAVIDRLYRCGVKLICARRATTTWTWPLPLARSTWYTCPPTRPMPWRSTRSPCF